MNTSQISSLYFIENVKIFAQYKVQNIKQNDIEFLYLKQIAKLNRTTSTKKHNKNKIDFIRDYSQHRWHQLVKDQLRGGQFAIVAARATFVAKSWISGIVLLCSITPTAGSVSQHNHLDLLFKMVPSIPKESSRIIDMHFCVKRQIFQVDLSQREPYFEVTISNLYS